MVHTAYASRVYIPCLELEQREGEISPTVRKTRQDKTHPQRREEPAILAGRVALLEQLFDRLLGILALRRLFEGVVRNRALETLQLDSVSCWEKM